MNNKRILEIGNWPPPVCSWSMSLVGLRKELEARGWDCQIMNLNENRRVRSPEYIDVQSGPDYFWKVLRHVWRGYAVHVRVNGETKKGYFLALAALMLSRAAGRPALLTYGGGHQQSYFPAPKGSLQHLAFSFLFRIPRRIYCNSDAVKKVLLITGIPAEKVEPIPHFSTQYVEFAPAALPAEVEEFYRKHDGVFFSYVCFRKEFALEFLANVIQRFREQFPRVGFLLVGPWDREMDGMKTFVRDQKIEDGVCLLPSVPHDTFLTLLSRSLAYIRTPVTDGICSSVLESLKLKVPVLAADNDTRPAGTGLWKEGDINSLLKLMTEAASDHARMVAAIPEIEVEDNARKLADSIERVSLKKSLTSDAHELRVKTWGAGLGSQEMMVQGGGEGAARSKAPVFVLGCGRSGTTLLYHMILSAGNFAVYRTESNAINLLEPRFGDLSVKSNKEKLMEAWFDSKLGQRSGLDPRSITAKVIAECRNGGDFLRIVMSEIARQQGVQRWADCTPEHLLHLERIKETIPEALIIHIIRDGRDVALSTGKLGYVRQMWWDRTPNVMVSGLYWEWMVRRGREYGRKLGGDYIEVRFEELISNPRATLATLSAFIGQELDYDHILKVGIGSVSEPNTSFKDLSDRVFNPLERWRKGFTPKHLAMFEALVGNTLEELGYELGTADRAVLNRPELRQRRAIYRRYFDTKLWIKVKTPLGQIFVTKDLSWL